jgi:hypothetical protein
MDLWDLIPTTIPRPADAGELLLHFLDQLQAAQPKHKYQMPVTLAVSPENTLLLSLQKLAPRPRADSKNTVIIVQIDRLELTGRRNTTKTQFPRTLDRMCQSIAGCGNQGAEYELQAVVVHQGTPNKGHYIALLKPKGGPHWAKFDDAAVNGYRRQK